MTVNILPSGTPLPSTVTCHSLMASKSADWVRGEERLISSAKRTSLKIGPGERQIRRSAAGRW